MNTIEFNISKLQELSRDMSSMIPSPNTHIARVILGALQVRDFDLAISTFENSPRSFQQLFSYNFES